MWPFRARVLISCVKCELSEALPEPLELACSVTHQPEGSALGWDSIGPVPRGSGIWPNVPAGPNLAQHHRCPEAGAKGQGGRMASGERYQGMNHPSHPDPSPAAFHQLLLLPATHLPSQLPENARGLSCTAVAIPLSYTQFPGLPDPGDHFLPLFSLYR